MVHIIPLLKLFCRRDFDIFKKLVVKMLITFKDSKIEIQSILVGANDFESEMPQDLESLAVKLREIPISLKFSGNLNGTRFDF